ncbi:MAG: hypothetical protein ABH858_01180 [Candidatus Omnitrophota bacterium]
MSKIKFFLLGGIILFVLSCAQEKEKVIVIGDLKISRQEFEDAFRKSIYGQNPKKEARREFLEAFLQRKLLLKEAERVGLDKDGDFLESIQSFWEQALLKLIIDRKIKELSLGIRVNETDVKEFYQEHKETFPDKELTEVYDQVKLLVFRYNQEAALKEWMDSLNKAKVEINYKLLNLE